MLHAPTSETKTETTQSKSQMAPQPGRELHPHAFGTTGVYALNGAASVRPPGAERHQIFADMQATHGNQAVLRMMQNSPQVAHMTALRPSQGVMLQRKSACGGTPESQGECAACKAKQEGEEAVPTLVQAKLNVSEPEDSYEQEANQVAERVTRMAVPGSPLAPATSGSSTARQATMNAPAIVHGVLSSNEGQPLDEATRTFMEPRFGYDFGQVRVHTDEQAVKSAEAINALAYTVGRDVVFATGQYAPGTIVGQRLLAHELTHVIQQNTSQDGPNIQRQVAVIPHYRDCTPVITTIANPDEELENARLRARRFVDAAISVLAAAPAAGTTYATALNRHFITPNAAQRATIKTNYQHILNTLVVPNFICNSEYICGAEQAKWMPDDDLIHVCRPFWPLSINCRAIILIHEGAHDSGIDIAGAHTPNRGEADYPAGNVAPPVGVMTADRMNTPDAYAFFAAHIWRDSDTGTTCFP